MNYTLFLPYPLSVNRYWRHTSKGTYISQEGKQFKNNVHAKYLYRIKPTDKAVALNILIHPKTTSKGLPSSRLIDLDNSLKCILDSLNHIIYKDDKQVQSITLNYGKPQPNGGATVSTNEYINEE